MELGLWGPAEKRQPPYGNSDGGDAQVEFELKWGRRLEVIKNSCELWIHGPSIAGGMGPPARIRPGSPAWTAMFCGIPHALYGHGSCRPAAELLKDVIDGRQIELPPAGEG
jgi:hypothetical protein